MIFLASAGPCLRGSMLSKQGLRESDRQQRKKQLSNGRDKNQMAALVPGPGVQRHQLWRTQNDEVVPEAAFTADEIVLEAASTVDEVVPEAASKVDEAVPKATSTADMRPYSKAPTRAQRKPPCRLMQWL